jgi:hypothetical protein
MTTGQRTIEKGDGRFEGDVELHKKEDGKTGNERGES